MTTITYDVPSVHCGHCQMTIEREVGELAGVVSVSVDIDGKQTTISFVPPATSEQIEAYLDEIGYSVQKLIKL